MRSLIKQAVEVELPSGKLRLSCGGNARSGIPAVLYIHGIGDSKEDFQPVFDYEPMQTNRLVAVDLLGFGESSKPVDFQYNLEDQAEVCRQLVEALDLKPLHIVAHSVGGAVGVLLAEQIADRLAGFTSIEGNLVSDDCGIVTRKTASMSFETYLAEEYPARFSRLKESGWSTYSHEAMLPLAFYRTAISAVDWSDGGRLLSSFLNLPCPKFYLYGDQNRSYPVIAKLEGVTLVEVSASGHRPMDDNPQEFCEKLYNGIAG